MAQQIMHIPVLYLSTFQKYLYLLNDFQLEYLYLTKLQSSLTFKCTWPHVRYIIIIIYFLLCVCMLYQEKQM